MHGLQSPVGKELTFHGSVKKKFTDRPTETSLFITSANKTVIKDALSFHKKQASEQGPNSLRRTGTNATYSSSLQNRWSCELEKSISASFKAFESLAGDLFLLADR